MLTTEDKEFIRAAIDAGHHRTIAVMAAIEVQLNERIGATNEERLLALETRISPQEKAN